MGFSCVTTVVSPAVSQALTTLAGVKVELGINSTDTTKDAFLNQAISQISARVVKYCKRPFAPEQVQDVFDIEQDAYPYQTPGGFPQLQLSRWPVLDVVSVVQTLAVGNTGNNTQTLIAGTDFRLDAETGRLLRLNPYSGVGTTWEALPVTVIYTAGYGALVQETDTVPAGSPYTVTVQQAATFSCDVGVSYANGTALAAVSGTPDLGQYSVNAGAYTFAAGDASQALTFSYATGAIPPDLTEVVMRLITARYASRGRDPAMIQMETPGVGIQRYWFGGAPGQTGAFTPEIQAMLDDFRVPTVA